MTEAQYITADEAEVASEAQRQLVQTLGVISLGKEVFLLPLPLPLPPLRPPVKIILYIDTLRNTPIKRFLYVPVSKAQNSL